jgi:hypothetical protein
MRTRLWLLSFSLAGLLSMLAVSGALAVPVVRGPLTPVSGAVAGAIAGLVNQYLQDSIGATNTGDWLDAAPAGTSTNRGQSLLIPGGSVDGLGPNPLPLTIEGFNDGIGATIHYNDGAGNAGTVNTLLTQFSVTLTGAGGPVSFDTFCIDLFHAVSDGQTYNVNLRDDLDTALANGARMAYIFQNFGQADLSSNPNQAAAVAITLWDLLVSPDPTSFGLDTDGSYSSGDESTFSVTFASPVPEPAGIAVFATGLAAVGYLRRRLGKA